MLGGVSNGARYHLLMTSLVAALLLAYLSGNGSVPLFDRDEPRYALTSRAMLESGDFVVPRLMDEVRTAKPPAIYWLQAGAMQVFGFTEFAARLPGALGCAATVALLAIWLPPLVGRRRAAWTSFTFGTSVLVLGVAKVGVIDGVLVLFAAIMQLALLQMVVRRGDVQAGAVLLWVAVGCAGLLKGPVILGVLGMTLLAWSMMQVSSGAGGSADLRPSRLRPLLGLGLLILICGPWLYLISQQEPTFVTRALTHDVARRSVQGLEGHGQLPGFHLLVLFATWFPWSVLLPAALLDAWRRRKRRTHLRFALAACIGPWVMFELVVTKLPHYLLVIFPMLALLTADWIVRHLRHVRRRSAAPKGMRTAASIYAGVALMFAALPVGLGAGSLAATTLALTWGAGLLWSWWSRRLAVGILMAGLGLPVLVGLAFIDWLGRAPILTVSQRTAAALHREGAVQAAMVHYQEPSLAWYAQTARIQAREAAEAVLGSDQYDFAVSTGEAWNRVAPVVQQRWQVVTGVRARLYNERMQVREVLVLRRIPSSEINMTD